MATDTATATARTSATRALLGLHLVVLSIGVLHFAFLPNATQRPLLAAGALALSTIVVILARVLPKADAPRGHAFEIAVMIATINALTLATGGTASMLLALNSVPLAAIGAAFASWWAVLVGMGVLATIGFVLGVFTPNTDVGSPAFALLLLSTLAPGAAVGLLISEMTERIQNAVQKIRTLAATDALTGLINSRTFEQVLQQAHRKAERYGRSYSLVMVDVDNLAHINETLGHEAGSMILNAVASAIARSVRSSDVAARLGGDEFVVLCVESTPDIGAAIAQRIRNNVYASTVSVANRLIRANVSVGVANFPADHLYPKELMNLANRRMHEDRELRVDPRAVG